MKRTNVEIPEKYVYRITLTADAQELEDAVQAAYLHSRDQIQIPGCEKGQADRAAIEAANGESFFWYEAINTCMAEKTPALLEEAIQELGLNPVTDPAFALLYASTQEGFAATATLVTEPEITLGAYTGFQADCIPNPLGEHDVDHFIQRRRQRMAEKVAENGPAAPGMVAVVDYEGFVNEVAFAGGKGQDQAIRLGAGRMIPGFEEAILGHCPGDDFAIHVTFPKDYQARELAGQPAVFRSRLKALYRYHLPELDDTFARRAGEVDTMEQYREKVREELEALRLDNAMNRARTEIVRQLGKNSTGALPDLLTEDAFQAQLEQLQQQLAVVRKPLKQYLEEVHMTQQELFAKLRMAAAEQARVHLALLQVARKEGLEPTEADVDAQIETEAKRAGCTPEEYLEQVDRRTVRRGLCAAAAADFVVEHSTITVKP